MALPKGRNGESSWRLTGLLDQKGSRFFKRNKPSTLQQRSEVACKLSVPSTAAQRLTQARFQVNLMQKERYKLEQENMP